MDLNSIDKIRQVNDKKAELETKERQHKEQLDRSASLESVLFNSFQSLVTVLEGNGDKAEAIAMVVRALDKLDKEGSDNKTELATVKAGLTELEQQLKDVPIDSLKQIPKFLQQRDVIKVTNLSELDKGFAQIEKAIKNMELTVEAPQVSVKAPNVNVPAPIVNVPGTDLKPLQTAMLDVVKAVKAVKIPKPSTVDLSKLEKEAKTHTRLLKEISDKPTGGGGGGASRASPYSDSNDIPTFPSGVVSTTDPTKKGVVVLNPDGTSIGVGNQPSTPTVTTVGDTVTSTQLIASNTSRKEVEFYNGSTAILYLLKGTGTASATNYTVQLNQGDYYNSDVTSAFQGVWASDAAGNVLITSTT